MSQHASLLNYSLGARWLCPVVAALAVMTLARCSRVRRHVFPDGSGKGGGKGWSHFMSKDLLRWTEQSNSTMADGDTGSVSITDDGSVVTLYPDDDTPAGGNTTRALKRQTAVGGKLTLDVKWSAPTVAVDKPASLGKGMRDPARALKMPDGHYYVGAGSGFGGTGPNSNSKTGLPDSGTGCLAWFRAKDSTLSSLEYVGCLLENNHTTGHIDPGTVSYSDKDMVAAFFECPDVFPLGDKYVAMASLYNWHAGGYYTNEYAKTVAVLSHFHPNAISLPTQARDKHRETPENKTTVFLDGSSAQLSKTSSRSRTAACSTTVRENN